MELNTQKKLWNFLDEERIRNTNSTQRFSFRDNNEDESHLSTPRTSCVSANSIPIWTINPITTSPSQSLLYHCLASLHRTEGKIFSITLTKDLIFTGSSSSRIHVWKKQDFTEMGFIKASCGQIKALLACSNLLITTHGDFKIRVWDINMISSSHMERFRPRKMTTLPSRKSIFSYSNRKNAQHNDFVTCLAYNNMEKLLYTGSCDQTVRVWKISEKKCIDTFLAHDGLVNAIVINQEDGCVFTCSSDGTVKIWRRVFRESSHMLTMTLKFQPSPINCLALTLISPNNCFLYSGSSDGLINFWEKEKVSGRYNHGGFLQGHHFAVLCLVTIEDLIISGSEDASIRVWKRENGNCFLHTCLAVIDGHHGPVKCLAADVESHEINVNKCLLVYSASLDQTLKVWRVKVYYGDEKVMRLDKKGGDGKNECKMSPVLSPSWVEKKIQGSDY